MAQLKDLIVNGPSRFIGDVYATTFTGNLEGNASTATTAAICTGNSATATALTTNAGSTNTPVYFTGGKPSAISITAGTSDTERPLVVVTDNNELYKTSGITANYSKKSITATTFKGNLEGNASTATSAAMATSAADASRVGGLSVHSGRNNEVNKIVRTDENGYLQVGYINSSSGHEKNASSPTYVWGSNSSDSYLRSYQTSSLSVKYATTSGSCSGNAATATKATQDGNGNVITSTYLPTSGGNINGTESTPININTSATTEVGINFNMSGSPKGWVGYTPNVGSYLYVHSVHRMGLSDAGVGFIDSNTLLHSGNYNSYSPKLDGTGASGTWGINISGNAASSTKATQDGNGNTITTTYLPKSSGTVNAICSTSASLSAKKAASENFILTTGINILITFTVENTYKNKMTLNVNGTGAKTLYINDKVSSASNSTIPAGTYNCHYSGSAWYLDTENAFESNIFKVVNLKATSGFCLLYGSTVANAALHIGVDNPYTSYPYTTYSLYMARKGIAVGGFASTSDMTMKDRIEDLYLNFDDVASMPIFKFRWKDREAHGDNINIGTSAQYWVSKEPLLVDGTEGSYSIQYGVLALACVKTTAEKVKELEDKVLELQEEIKTLKAL